jgi:hypothetical protein
MIRAERVRSAMGTGIRPFSESVEYEILRICGMFSGHLGGFPGLNPVWIDFPDIDRLVDELTDLGVKFNLRVSPTRSNGVEIVSWVDRNTLVETGFRESDFLETFKLWSDFLYNQMGEIVFLDMIGNLGNNLRAGRTFYADKMDFGGVEYVDGRAVRLGYKCSFIDGMTLKVGI